MYVNMYMYVERPLQYTWDNLWQYLTSLQRTVHNACVIHVCKRSKVDESVKLWKERHRHAAVEGSVGDNDESQK